MITALGVYGVDVLGTDLPASAWQRMCAGRGAKGDTATTTGPWSPGHATDRHGGHHWLLICRVRRPRR
jgi:hypothetical protein